MVVLLMSKEVNEAVTFVKQKINSKVPIAAVVLGSGLGKFADSLKDKIEIPYSDIPHWPKSTAPGHAGKLVFGNCGGNFIVTMQGRVHYYEGYGMSRIIFPVKVFAKLGVKYYIATNASGGIDLGLNPGDLVLIYDHINFMGTNPLIGEKDESGHPPFVDMTYTYDKMLMDIAEEEASKNGIQLKRGVYIAFSGPSFETPAEIRMARTLGAQIVGMSTVPEVIAARWLGMKILAISCVANYAAGITEAVLTHEEVLEEMNKASDKLIKLLSGVINRLNME